MRTETGRRNLWALAYTAKTFGQSPGRDYLGLLNPYDIANFDTAAAFCLLREEAKQSKAGDEPEWGALESGQPLSNPKVTVRHFSPEQMARGEHLGAMQ